MGCYEVSMGDTIGVGTPLSIMKMFQVCSLHFGLQHIETVKGCHMENLTSTGVSMRVCRRVRPSFLLNIWLLTCTTHTVKGLQTPLQHCSWGSV